MEQALAKPAAPTPHYTRPSGTRGKWLLSAHARHGGELASQPSSPTCTGRAFLAEALPQLFGQVLPAHAWSAGGWQRDWGFLPIVKGFVEARVGRVLTAANRGGRRAARNFIIHLPARHAAPSPPVELTRMKTNSPTNQLGRARH